MPFQAWSFPPGFSGLRGTSVIASPEGLPELEIPELSTGGLKDLLSLLRKEGAGFAMLGTDRILEAVDRVTRRLGDAGDPLRRDSLEEVRVHAGYSRSMAARVLDGMMRDWTRDRLEALLRSEFPDPGVLDGFRPGPAGGRVRARGYPLVFHLGAGSVPGVTTTSMIRALLAKSASLVKPGRGDVALPVLFARALTEADPEVGRSLAVVYWPGPREERTREALRGVDLVVVYGADDTLEWVRARTPPTTQLRAYRHRMGVALVGSGGLMSGTAVSTARAAAEAVALFDQRGCVSPQVIFVEEGGETAPDAWAELLAEALERLELTLPSGPVPGEAGAALQQWRGAMEVEESLGKGFVRHGGESAPWAVHYSPDPFLEPSCLNRAVRVIPVKDLRTVPDLLEPWRPHLQTVGVGGIGDSRESLAEALAGLGVSRVAPLETMAWPPAWWHHDGTGPLRSLVRWTDLEDPVG
ncbi:MAG: acyl-CoA reductase [Longimicrobiales bacterium]